MYNSLVLLFFSSFFVAVPVVILLYCSCRSRLSSKISQTQTFARASRIGRKQSANTDRQTKLKPASNSASLVLSLTHSLTAVSSEPVQPPAAAFPRCTVQLFPPRHPPLLFHLLHFTTPEPIPKLYFTTLQLSLSETAAAAHRQFCAP